MFSLVVFSAGLLATAGLLPLIGVSFAFGLLLVNQELDKFHFIFAGFTFCQVCCLFLEINTHRCLLEIGAFWRKLAEEPDYFSN